MIYEYRHFTKKRSNQKKWDYSHNTYSEVKEYFNEDIKNKNIEIIYKNIDDIEQVKEFNNRCDIIVISPLGIPFKEYDFAKLLELEKECNFISDITGKKTVIYRPHENK
jgi:hypothetical protein